MSYFDFDFDLCCACSPRHPRQRKSFETTDSLSISRARDYDTTIEFYWASMLAEPSSAVVHHVGERIIRPRRRRSTRGPKLGKRVGHHGHKASEPAQLRRRRLHPSLQGKGAVTHELRASSVASEPSQHRVGSRAP